MKKYYIKERHNPQLGVYYALMGQMSKTAAKKYEHSLYGDNYMIGYDTEGEYLEAIEKLKSNGSKIV
jgi:hypothetical protein